MNGNIHFRVLLWKKYPMLLLLLIANTKSLTKKMTENERKMMRRKRMIKRIGKAYQADDKEEYCTTLNFVENGRGLLCEKGGFGTS